MNNTGTILYCIKINFKACLCSGQYLGNVEINKNNKTTDATHQHNKSHADMHTNSNHLNPFLLLLNIKQNKENNKKKEKNHCRNTTTSISSEQNKYQGVKDLKF